MEVSDKRCKGRRPTPSPAGVESGFSSLITILDRGREEMLIRKFKEEMKLQS
jgi:hypothetical protein